MISEQSQFIICGLEAALDGTEKANVSMSNEQVGETCICNLQPCRRYLSRQKNQYIALRAQYLKIDEVIKIAQKEYTIIS